ncbi:MAG: hypothetical protein Q7R39_14455 [Dehalococcoidia bacterium]|nr:hypothetical protein [Dehalococcoidia bacterium]
MDYQIALSPDLGLTPEAFAEAWNGIPQCHQVADAQVRSPEAGRYGPETAATVVALLTGVGGSLVAAAIYDLVRHVLTRQGITRRTEIKLLEQPDGTRLLVITVERK